MPAEADAGERRIGEHVGQDRVIGWPVLEALRHVADHLIRDAPRGHPRGDQLLVFVGIRLLGAGIGGENQVRPLAPRFEFDE